MLGDRDVNVTLKRTWAALSAWQKAKFLWNLIYTGINVPDADELSNLLEEMKVQALCPIGPRQLMPSRFACAARTGHNLPLEVD